MEIAPIMGPFRIEIPDQPHHKLQLPDARRSLGAMGPRPLVDKRDCRVQFQSTGGGLKAFALDQKFA